MSTDEGELQVSVVGLVDLNWTIYLAILTGTTALHGLAVGVALAATTFQSPIAITVAAIVGGLCALMRLYKVPLAVGRIVFVFLHSVELVLAVATLGWAPVTVWFGMYVSIAVGVFFGRRGVWFFSSFLCLVLLFGAGLTEAGVSFETAAGAVNDPSVWFRVGLLHLLVVAGMAVIVAYMLSVIVTADTESRNVHAAMQEQRQALVAARQSRSATELQIGEAQKIQSLAHLTRGLAHLVNNALTVVRTAADRLARGKASTEIQPTAREISEAANQCAQAIDDILAFSRRTPPERRLVYVQDELADFEAVLRQTAPKDIELLVRLDELPPIMADPLRLRQSVLNLMLNALAATTSGGSIRITLESRRVGLDGIVGARQPLSPGRYAVVTVEDDGSGMDGPTLERATDPFFTTRVAQNNEGLGLTVVQNVVESFDGAIVLNSTVGAGTRAALYIPHADLTTSKVTVSQDSDSSAASADESGPTPAELESFDTSDDWMQPSAERMVRSLTLLFGIATGTTLFLGTFNDVASLVVGAAGTIVCLVTLLSNKPTTVLQFVWIMVAIVAAAGLVIVRNGFMTPVAMTVLTTGVLLCAVYTNKAITVGALLLSTSLFFMIPLVSDLQVWNDGNVDIGISRNWVRIGLLWPVVLLFNADLILDVLDAAQGRITAVSSATLEMRRLQIQGADENNALLGAQRTAERAMRVEATGRAVSVVAHDINNALNSILGWSALLERDPNPRAEDVAEAAAAFESSVRVASKLASQLRPMSDHVRTEPAAVEMSAEVTACKSRIRQLLMHPFAIAYDLNKGVYAPVERVEFSRILMNLVSNARDAMGDSGVVTIRCFRNAPANEAVLEVSDTGSGIDEQLHRRIFDPYFTTKSTGRGTGLGLYSVLQMVESSGGQVALESKVGHGTTISVRWPQAPQVEQTPPPHSKQVSTDIPTLPILLAEDDVLVRKILVAGLRRAGFNVVAATDGTDALEKMALAEDWAALCTDAVMPGASVTTVYECFRQQFPTRPVLLISGYVPEELNDVRLAPDVRFLPKPVTPLDLCTALLEEIAQSGGGSRAPAA